MTFPPTRERRTIAVRGIVQGVGFRPFIYTLAQRYELAGSVYNDAQGVQVEVEGCPRHLDFFLRDISEEAPPLASVQAVTWSLAPARGDEGFRIDASRHGDQRQALISPDAATCAQCLAEMFDPIGRRYRYPFINCTNCGPRFTITQSVPYDRAKTTMVGFTMCTLCQREYDDSADRRFHAQPNACSVCGPKVRLMDPSGQEMKLETVDAIQHAVGMLGDGAIVAVKGLGGYHLACDPFSSEAVVRLRGRKVRQDKPFALMARDLEHVRSLCQLVPGEEVLLTAPSRPIVLLQRRENDGVADEVAPRQPTLGVMLAYTPLHHLLLHDAGVPLVMTSGNRSDEPIAYRDDEALHQLGHIADILLVHDRPIHVRCDDSIVRLSSGAASDGAAYPLRRSRGFAPAPVDMTGAVAQHTLACGGELKNTFCLAKERHAFVSHHIGDLENYETLVSFREGIDHYCRLFDVRPTLVVYDLHPEYLSTKYARELEENGMPAVGIQHHHAHIASCLADNGRQLEERVIGVAMDGTGYGTDGTLWGGEFFEGSVQEGFERRAHLASMALPGGAAAIREPWRVVIAYLIERHTEEELLKSPLEIVRRVGERNIHLIAQILVARAEMPAIVPLTSSAGRLFDAAAALLGLPGSMRTTYEGQAAIELEMVASGSTSTPYPFRLHEGENGWVVETGDILDALVEDVVKNVSTETVASRFHRTVAEVILQSCRRIRDAGGPTAVALSGGTFQNMLLLRQAVDALRENEFEVYLHRRVPANDGGISLGQVVLADSVLRRGLG
ncbi:MAG: carbamoyltransferase HypF [Chloroflexota bacterium]